MLGNQPAIEPLMGGGAGRQAVLLGGQASCGATSTCMGGVLPPPGLYTRILREVETPLIEIALEATGGNQAQMCRFCLASNRNTLRKKITDLDYHA